MFITALITKIILFTCFKYKNTSVLMLTYLEASTLIIDHLLLSDTFTCL
jgi:hypothetical protein